jgi:hypothetical protein
MYVFAPASVVRTAGEDCCQNLAGYKNACSCLVARGPFYGFLRLIAAPGRISASFTHPNSGSDFPEFIRTHGIAEERIIAKPSDFK